MTNSYQKYTKLATIIKKHGQIVILTAWIQTWWNLTPIYEIYLDINKENDIKSLILKVSINFILIWYWIYETIISMDESMTSSHIID